MSKIERFFAAIGKYQYAKATNSILTWFFLIIFMLFFPFIGPLVFIQHCAPNWSIEAENGFVGFYTLLIQVPSLIGFLYVLSLYK